MEGRRKVLEDRTNDKGERFGMHNLGQGQEGVYVSEGD